MADESKAGVLVEALRPFARYADGIGHFTGPQGMFDWSFESHEIGRREITEADFARARQALSTTATPASDGGFGYADAFYEIAAMLGIGARVDSPAKVWADEMKPMLSARLTPDRFGEGYRAAVEASASHMDERAANRKAAENRAREDGDIEDAVTHHRIGNAFRSAATVIRALQPDAGEGA